MSLFNELKRRNVIRVAIAYLVIGWVLAQVSGTFEEALNLPEWFDTMVLTLLMLGFPITLFFSWAFELTPEGIKHERDVIRDESITSLTAKKLDYITLISVLGVVSFLVWQKMNPIEISNDSTSVPIMTVETTEENTLVQPLFKAKLGEQSIAVLPFANRSNLADDVFFTDGIHDDLLTQLSKISDLKVISRTSVMNYRETDKKIPQIAQELGVANILEGGVQRAGQRIRINAQLINVATDEHLWAETYDREMTIDNLFEIQSEITKQIVSQIKGKLTDNEQQLLDDKPTNSLAAWELYSKARLILMGSGHNSKKYLQAEPLLEKAVTLDVDFTLAHVALADIHGMLFWMSVDQTIERKNKAKYSLDKAIELSPNSAEVLSAQGEYFYRLEEDFSSALAMQNLALKAKPSDADIMQKQGLAQRRVGLWQESINSFLQAYKLNPNDLNNISLAIATLDSIRDSRTIEEFLPNALNKFSNNGELGSYAVVKELWSTGNVVKARQIHNTLVPESSSAYTIATIRLAWCERDPQKVILAWQIPEIIQLTLDSPSFKKYSLLDQTRAYRLLGDEAKANELLEQFQLIIGEDKHVSQRKYNKAEDLIYLANFYNLMDNKPLPKEYAEQAMLMLPPDQDTLEGMSIKTFAIFALARSGNRDRALTMIEELLELPNGFKRWELYLDKRWDFFRDDERFNKLIEPHNLDQSIHAFRAQKINK